MNDIEDIPQKTGLEGNIKLLPSQNLQSYNADLEDLNRLSGISEEVKRTGTLDEPIKETIVILLLSIKFLYPNPTMLLFLFILYNYFVIFHFFGYFY